MTAKKPIAEKVSGVRKRRTEGRISSRAERVLSEIIGLGTSEDTDPDKRNVASPGYRALQEYAELLAAEPPEEELQQFLTTRPQFLMGLFGARDIGDIAFLCKPPVGTSYVADFALLGFGQGGCVIRLVELEPSTAPLFTKNRTPARRLQGALGQLNDWRRWIERNQSTFVRDMLDRAVRSPLVSPKKSGSVRFKSPSQIRAIFEGFDGLENCEMAYAIVIGRWASMGLDERRLLIHHNQTNGGIHRVHTFDQLGRQALVRPDVVYNW